MRHRLGLLSAALVTGTMALAGGPVATATSHAPWQRTISDSVLAPFQIAVHNDDVYATDGFLGTVTKYPRLGGTRVLAQTQGETAGLDVSADGRQYAYTGTDAGGAYLEIVTGRGSTRVDLGAYEATHNPDGNVTYGIIGRSNPCAVDFFEQISGGPAKYQGIVESHPYAVASLDGGAWAVADAAGNTILVVTPDRRIRTLAVMPRQPITLTADMVADMGFPPCTTGVTYAFEPVPTDVERDVLGMLAVSVLPGGPEDASLGARGKVYRVNARTGAVRQSASGFSGATNLAVAPEGTVYVAELFADKVTAVRGSHRWTAYQVPGALSVEVARGSLYIGTLADLGPDFEVLGPGSLVQIRR